MHKLLIADSNPQWRTFSKEILEQQDYKVFFAENIEKLSKYIADNEYDLILVNAEMMIGKFRETMHQLFFRNLDKPIIVISLPSTDYQAVQETRTAFKMGAKDYVEKPFSGEKLLRLVADLLNEFVSHQKKEKFQGT